MAKRPAETTEYSWHIYRIRGTPAAYVGMVYAPDEKTAIQRAIEDFGITNPEQQKRLIAERRG